MNAKFTYFLVAAIITLSLSACDSNNSSQRNVDPIDETTDSDRDGLSDLDEAAGWRVTIYQSNGDTLQLDVNSDPNKPDTDNDGVLDSYEKSSLINPRSTDTDDDELSDRQELYDIYSNPYVQDTDGDGLMDGLEFNFHLTSPVDDDTDGDQIDDSEEILLATRNARVSDLPSPAIEIGETNLQLDVRFTETTSVQTRELENRNVTATLTQSDRQEYSNTNSNTQQAHAKLSVGTAYKVKGSIFGPAGEFNTAVKFEGGWTGSWTSSYTATSAQETQNVYQESLTTDEETTEGASVTRSIEGARMSATVSLKNIGSLAYRIHNLQLTAFIQDPRDHTNLKPIATLLPDNEPVDGFHLGPLVPTRGPIIFSNDLVFPQLVQSLMKNPRGLVFTISNYDISDELGRNFVFSSQEVVERTAALVIDFGSFDSDGDNEGDLTEYHRIATSSGRVMDGGDQRIVFDEDGGHVGITLRDALDAIGLTHYDEDEVASIMLMEKELNESYSTIFNDEGIEQIFRVRNAAVEVGVPKAWEILTATGINQTIGLDDFILQTEDDIKLSFVQDVDEDRLVASIEFVHGCSDVFADTDGDGLDDRMETLIGWEVSTNAGSRIVYSRCANADTDNDGLTDDQEAGAPVDCDGDGNPDAIWITDPGNSDTDDDGISDIEEICGFSIELRNTPDIIFVTTDPTQSDTDGDTAPDGIERELRGNPRDPTDTDQFSDADGDGLVNIQETEGWSVTTYGVSFGINNDTGICFVECDQGEEVTIQVFSDPYNGDTDADGLPDGKEKQLHTNPDAADTDGDGLTDAEEVNGFYLRDQGIIVLDPLDADSDNDKRSDGAEAELDDLVTSRWIIHPFGEDPYRVYTDPRWPDADFDTLVDGDEYDFGSDPGLANTDGDSRDDAMELEAGLNPVRVDFKVTVIYRTLIITQPGELNWINCETAILLHGADGSQCGDTEFSFELSVRLPDQSTPTGLAPYPTVVTDDLGLRQYMDECQDNLAIDGWHHLNDPCVADLVAGIQMNNGSPFQLYHSDYGIPNYKRSITFSLTEDQRFSIEGKVGDYDQHGSDVTYHWLYFGGLDGITAEKDGSQVLAVFEGSDVISDDIENLVFKFSDPDWNSLTGPLIASALQTSPAEGEVQVMYIVE